MLAVSQRTLVCAVALVTVLLAFALPARAADKLLFGAYTPGDLYSGTTRPGATTGAPSAPDFGGWQSFSTIFSGVYERLKRLGPQPIWITEVASDDRGGDKAAWVRDMFATAAGMDRLESIVWFNEDKERNWRAAPTPQIAAAFANGTAQAASSP